VSNSRLRRRAAVFAALGDPLRLALVDELRVSDRSPIELGELVGIESNLVAHHLDILEDAGVIHRSKSSGDGRRRYVHLLRDSVRETCPPLVATPAAPLFVCTANSARSQLAAGLWTQMTGRRADSAGTHPAAQVHPGAIAAGERAGLNLATATPSLLDDVTTSTFVVTVCDRAHEELGSVASRWHWSIPDPVGQRTSRAFDEVVEELRSWISAVTEVAA